MSSLYDQVQQAKEFIESKTGFRPEMGVILGTGLGGLTRHLKARVEIPYADIPGFLPSTVSGHLGHLAIGKFKGRSVLVMEGRVHAYEGHSLQAVTFPVRVLHALGVKGLILTAACGGMNPRFKRGDIVLIEDHINLMGSSPLVGPNDERLGIRFPDMSRPYDRDLLALAERIALEEGIRTHQGVYVAVTGPNLETRAEYRFLRAAGADVVGMSTVPEVIVGTHAGLRILGLAVITDECLPDALKPVDLQAILAAASEAAPRLARIITRVLAEARL
ncbi:MAG: purine-nucleoside phosphorylase [Planctomycetes bacterium]|nr:purine-nucleoside phosphorylase [Planctomycetota bacterium]